MVQFDHIIGNAQTIKNLRGAMAHNMVSHAYILQGPFGSGKMLLGETFAAALNCDEGLGRLCGTCPSCKTIESRNNPDVFYVKPKKSKAIGADDIREQVVGEVEIRPYQHRYKIFIIENADTMTAAAQNVLLKTLEEPPSYGLFLLLAENADTFLPTVLSRCVQIKMSRLSEAEVENYMTNRLGIDAKEAAFYARYAAGSIGKAVKLSEDEGFREMRNFITDKLVQINNTDIVTVMLWAKELEKYKEMIYELLDVVYLWLRDVFAAKKLTDSRYIVQQDKESQIRQMAKEMDFSQLEMGLSAVWTAKSQLEHNGNFQLTMEIMLMNIKGV